MPEMLMLAESYLHRLDPFMIQISEGFGLRWYGMSYAAGFLIGWLILRWFAASGRSPMSVRQVGDLMFAAIVGVLLGGRLGYVLFYAPHLLIDFRASLPYWGVLAINDGGMASHGGMIGVLLACWWMARRHNVPLLHLLDLGAIGCLPGLFLGRIANFINAELWGRSLPAALRESPPWWSVKYPTQITEQWLRAANRPDTLDDQMVRRLADDLAVDGSGVPIEVLRDMVTMAATEKLAALEALRPALPPTEFFYARIVEAAYAGNQTVIEHVRPLLTPYYPSQLFQALTDGPLMLLLLVAVWWKPRSAGVVGGTFFIGYGIMRILSEQFRQPDDGVTILLGLSRGQLLSVGLVIAGIVLLVMARRRADGPKFGGMVIRSESPSQ